MNDQRIIELLEKLTELQESQNALLQKLVQQSEHLEKETSDAAGRVRASTDKLIRRSGFLSWDNIAMLVFMLLLLGWVFYKSA